MTKINSRKSERLLGFSSTILLMTGCFILLDLYVPLKRLLFGDSLNFHQILDYIKLKQHIPVIIAVSFALEYSGYRKSNK